MGMTSISFLREHNWRRDERNAEEWKWSVKSMGRYDNGRASYSRLSFSTSTSLICCLNPHSKLCSSFRTLNKFRNRRNAGFVPYASLSCSSFVVPGPVSTAEKEDAWRITGWKKRWMVDEVGEERKREREHRMGEWAKIWQGKLGQHTVRFLFLHNLIREMAAVRNSLTDRLRASYPPPSL